MTYNNNEIRQYQPSLHKGEKLPLGDAVEKIFVNPASRRIGLDSEFDEFPDYLQGKTTADGLVKEIEDAVEKAQAHKADGLVKEIEDAMKKAQAHKENGRWNI